MIWTVIVIVVLLAGIVLLNSGIFQRQTREQFLQSLAEFLEGKLHPIEGQPENWQIDFVFEEQPFFYEDVFEHGFKGNERKGDLKTRVHDDFTIYFTEKPRSTTIKTDLIISSNVPAGAPRPDAWVVLPPSLKGLNVQTNNIRLANKLLADKGIVEILLQFRSEDQRGYPSMSWKIVDGVMTLEFHHAEGKTPNYRTLTGRISCMDNYLEDMLKIVQVFKTSL